MLVFFAKTQITVFYGQNAKRTKSTSLRFVPWVRLRLPFYIDLSLCVSQLFFSYDNTSKLYIADRSGKPRNESIKTRRCGAADRIGHSEIAQETGANFQFLPIDKLTPPHERSH